MSEAIARIVQLERRVMWRKRLLSLQDGLALIVTVGGLVAAGLVVLMRLRVILLPLWGVILGVVSLSLAAVLIHWFSTRSREQDAAFLIDGALGLEDRIATSHLIIERGGPKRPIEEAVIEDAAERLGNLRAAAVLPFSRRRWHSLALVSLIGLAVALMIPPRPLPISQALAAERGDIESAGEYLEQTAEEVEQVVPPETETSNLAKEQAELGRSLQRLAVSRAVALKKLSVLEERIRQRRDDLASTRSDEIVSLAERRLGSAVSTPSTARSKKLVSDERETAPRTEGTAKDTAREPSKEGATRRSSESAREQAGKSDSSISPGREPNKGDRSKLEDARQKGEAAVPQDRPQQPVSAEGAKSDSAKGTTGIAGELRGAVDKGKPSNRKPDVNVDVEKAGEQKTGEEKTGDDRSSEELTGVADAIKAMPDAMAEQAAKVLPKLSEELLKKAAELRANELSPADVEKLRKAAESLARDLAEIAQSKELQQALQEMASQIRPEQIERVARVLGNQEQLKQELEAAGRLLMENQQAKEIVAGLARQFERVRDEVRQQLNKSKQPVGGELAPRDEPAPGRNHTLRGKGAEEGKPTKLEKAAEQRSLAGRGRESSLAGKRQQAPGGEYLYLKSKAGVGAARAPYSSAYPQYRREAERSVGRTQIPPNLRSVVRKYFDAINPDAKRR